VTFSYMHIRCFDHIYILCQPVLFPLPSSCSLPHPKYSNFYFKVLILPEIAHKRNQVKTFSDWLTPLNLLSSVPYFPEKGHYFILLYDWIKLHFIYIYIDIYMCVCVCVSHLLKVWLYNGLNVCMPPKLVCWNLKPNVLRGRAFWRWFDHENDAVLNGISALKKGTPENYPFLMCENSKSQQSGNWKGTLIRHWICWCHCFEFPSLQNY
jgi:hypothetical protein